MSYTDRIQPNNSYSDRDIPNNTSSERKDCSYNPTWDQLLDSWDNVNRSWDSFGSCKLSVTRDIPETVYDDRTPPITLFSGRSVPNNSYTIR